VGRFRNFAFVADLRGFFSSTLQDEKDGIEYRELLQTCQCRMDRRRFGWHLTDKVVLGLSSRVNRRHDLG